MVPLNTLMESHLPLNTNQRLQGRFFHTDMNTYKAACKNKHNTPIFLVADDGRRVDIPALGSWQGSLDDRQKESFDKLVENGLLEAVEYVDDVKKLVKNNRSKK